MCAKIVELLFTTVCLLVLTTAEEFNLHGNRTSYAGFPAISLCSHFKLALEFKTYLPVGLLAYQESEESILEIKLVKGQLQVKLELQDIGSAKLQSGENLNDSTWHRVSLERIGENAVLAVDTTSVRKQLHSVQVPRTVSYNNTDHRSSMYIGGLPERDDGINSLMFSTAPLEPSFAGNIANLTYKTNCTGGSFTETTPGMLPTGDVRSADRYPYQQCVIQRPCQDGSKCLLTDLGVICDCSYTTDGPWCTIARSQTVATFTGVDYLSYNFSGQGESIVSQHETVRFSFRTKTGDGMIFYTGNRNSYMNIGLVEGIVYLVLNMGDEQKIERIGQGRQFDDDYWHEVSVVRDITQLIRDQGLCTVVITIDGMYETSRSLAGRFTSLISRSMFVGGAPSTRKLAGTLASQNFHGCLKDVVFQAGSIQLEPLYMAKMGTGLFSSGGQVTYDRCEQVDNAKPVSMPLPDSFLALESFQSSPSNFIALTFSTTEPDGLLLYAAGQGSNVFALELFGGKLFIILDHGSTVVRQQLGSSSVNTGALQQVYITFKSWGASVTLNGVPKTVNAGGTEAPYARFTSRINLGGMDFESGSVYIHPAVYTAGLHQGFVGCLQDVKIDGMAQDLALLGEQQHVELSRSCEVSGQNCLPNTCIATDASCIEGWNRAICDCTQTSHSGSFCERDAIVARFDGSQHFTVTPRMKLRTLAERIVIRFRTYHSQGAILSTRSKDRQSGVEIFLYHSKLYIKITLRGLEHMQVAGEVLNDNSWHSLIYEREVRKVKIALDGETAIDKDLPAIHRHESLLSQAITIDEIRLGQPIDGSSAMLVSDGLPLSKEPFIGHIQKFVFNNIPYISRAYRGSTTEISYTSEFTADRLDPFNPVSFGSPDTHVKLDEPLTNGLYSIYLRLRTGKDSGIVLYRGGRNGDYIALELIQGKLNYVFNTNGQFGSIESRRKIPIDDNRWHDITILRANHGDQYLIVDGQRYISTRHGNATFHLDGPLYIGGTTTETLLGLPPTIRSPSGFSGCLASLDINGFMPDLFTEGTGDRLKLATGCVDYESCREGVCQNGGRCVQSWPSVNCQCDMTSFTGPTCSDDGTTYQFGMMQGGLLVYTFPIPKPDTTSDKLAFGFLTYDTDSTIIQLTSDNSADFLKVLIKDGRVVVRYNIGLETHELSDSTIVSDGEYHVLKLTREGSQAVLQVDDLPRRRRRPKGELLSVFNSMSELYIGGEMSRQRDIENYFSGLISGLNFNGINILDLAKWNHPIITIHGDARLTDRDSSKSFMILHMQPDTSEPVTDEIILPISTLCPDGTRSSDRCNEYPVTDELVTIKTISSRADAIRSTTKKPDIIIWPDPPTDSPVQTTRKRNELPEQRTAKKPDAAQSSNTKDDNNNRAHKPPSPHDTSRVTTPTSPFDLKKNLPLIAGISGAAVLTIVLIAVIICRLTRTEEQKYAENLRKTTSKDDDEDLRNEINSRPKNDPIGPDMPIQSNGVSRRTDGKEWYV